ALRPGEVQEALELDADRGGIRLDRRAIQQVALGRTARWIADHAGPPTDEYHGTTAVALEVDEAEDRHEVPDVEPRRRWIEAVVAGDRAARRQSRRQSGRRVVEHSAPLELGEKAARCRFSLGQGPLGARRIQPCRALGGRHTVAGRGVTGRRPGGAGSADRRGGGPSGGLCYRLARHEDQPRTAAALSPQWQWQSQ